MTGPSIPAITEAVAGHYRVKVKDLVGKGRNHEKQVIPRWLCWHVCKGQGNHGLRTIATAFGRSPWTVQWGLARFSEALMSEGPEGELAEALVSVYARLNRAKEVAS